jgi:hypothetical protein
MSSTEAAIPAIELQCISWCLGDSKLYLKAPIILCHARTFSVLRSSQQLVEK